MADNEPQHYPEPHAEDEIDLADLAAVLYRRRWLIVGGTLLVFLAGLAYALLQPTKYDVETYLSIGQMNGEYIQKPEAVPSQIRSLSRVYLVNHRALFDRKNLAVGEESASVSTEGGGIVRFALEKVPKDAAITGLMDTVIGKVVQEHETRIAHREERLQEEIRRLKEEQADLRERRKKLNSRLENLSDGGQTTTLRQLIEGLQNDLSRVDGKLSAARNQLDAIQESKMVMEPTYTEDPVAPNTKLIAALGLVLGGFLSVFLAFMVEFWVNNRERIVQG